MMKAAPPIRCAPARGGLPQRFTGTCAGGRGKSVRNRVRRGSKPKKAMKASGRSTKRVYAEDVPFSLPSTPPFQRWALVLPFLMAEEASSVFEDLTAKPSARHMSTRFAQDVLAESATAGGPLRSSCVSSPSLTRVVAWRRFPRRVSGWLAGRPLLVQRTTLQSVGQQKRGMLYRKRRSAPPLGEDVHTHATRHIQLSPYLIVDPFLFSLPRK